jgi:hypothetical protein
MGAAMQVFRNEVFSAPTSFFVLASLRQAVRFTCLAAASPDAADDADDAATAGAAADGGAAGASLEPAAAPARLKDTAAATAAKLVNSLPLIHARITSVNCRTDEAWMKLA